MRSGNCLLCGLSLNLLLWSAGGVSSACRTWQGLCKISVNNWVSARRHIPYRLLKSSSWLQQKPVRLLRRIKAEIFWRLFAREKPIQALDAYVCLATTVHCGITHGRVEHARRRVFGRMMLWHCEQCGDTERPLVTVTPRIFDSLHPLEFGYFSGCREFFFSPFIWK